MSNLTQDDQPIRVDTVLGEDVLLLAGFHGREEVSQPFSFHLELLSEDPNLDPADLLRTPISIGILLLDGEMRRVHGRVRSFGYEGRRGDFSFYRAEMVPWLWFLSLSKDCRIFQNMPVPEILEQVFSEEAGAQFRTHFIHEYAEREYCVQYRESNLNFVSRLMEEEGIFYFFEHSDGADILVLTDHPEMKPGDGQNKVRVHSGLVPQEDVIRSLTHKQSVHAGKVTLADYDQLKPSLGLRSSIAGDEADEIYEYQKNLFTELNDGERYARIALEREEAKHHLVQGQSTCRGFEAGRRFELTNHDRRDANREYAILEVSHSAQAGSYVAGMDSGELDYKNRFVAIPHGNSYRPPLRVSKPSMPGAQTAKVVGPAGEKINVDEHGRVKIQFHWDRLGSNDAGSSCWVRVSQNWAGNGWGGMFIPHVGQEVIVSFLEGDPDRPIITGRVYNAEQTPPQSLPANKHKSIIEDDFGNEMVFDATPGQEHIRIHSPSHLSTIELGRSVRWFTESDLSEIATGRKGVFTLGMQIGGFIGFKGDFELGGSLKVFGGFKFDLELSERFGMTFGPGFKVSLGKEYHFTKSTFEHHSGDDISVKSDKSSVLIGGEKNESMIGGDASEVIISYGSNSNAEGVTSTTRSARAAAYGAVAGVISSLAAAANWEVHRKPSAMWPFATVLPQMIHGAAGVGQAMKAAGSKDDARGGPKLQDVQDTVHAKIKLAKEGVFLYGMKDDSILSQIGVVGDGGQLTGRVVIQGDEGVLVRGEKGPTQIESGTKSVSIEGKTGVDINKKNSSAPVTIYGSSIKIDGSTIRIG